MVQFHVGASSGRFRQVGRARRRRPYNKPIHPSSWRAFDKATNEGHNTSKQVGKDPGKHIRSDSQRVFNMSRLDRILRPRIIWTCVRIALVCGLLTASAAAQDAAGQIKAQIEQLQTSLKSIPASFPGASDIKPQIDKQLQAASDALRSGRLYLSLENLASVIDTLQGMREVGTKSEAVKSAGFEPEWGKASTELTALDQKLRETKWDDAPAAIRALAEAAQGKMIPLLEGGHGFATASGAEAGLFYVGQARGEADFAQFCAGLNVSRESPPLPLHSVMPELEQLQVKTNDAFQPPRSIDLHSRFIRLNSALKLAQELDADGFHAGALYAYLVSTLHYGLLDAPALGDAQQSNLPAAIAAARAKLKSSGRDDSIAELFLERAESEITPANGSRPAPDDWRSAEVILSQVLPAYAAALQRPEPTAPPSAKHVEITLVRWPYT